MGFSEDILEVKKILKKQPFLKPASKENLAQREKEGADKPEVVFADRMMQSQYENMLDDGYSEVEARRIVTNAHRHYYGDAADFYGVGENIKEAGMFKPASKENIAARPVPVTVLHYHIYDNDDLSNTTDQWTTDFVLAVKMAKKLVQEGWLKVRIGQTEDSANDAYLAEEETVWFGGEDDFGGSVDYSSDQARADVEAGIDEALAESEKAFFKKAGEAEIDNRMKWAQSQNSEELRKEIEKAIDIAGRNKQRYIDKYLRRLWLANKNNAREDMVDLCVELAREAENIYIDSGHQNSFWKTSIWTIKELCYFSDEEERNFMDQIDALGI